ncbi:MAG: hypothetical protein LBN00_10610 [Oscillospiraceae bacterium]|jgi:hypothetical protein|nr:hypothetical protein [Oscillospiraceae bacterium]
MKDRKFVRAALGQVVAFIVFSLIYVALLSISGREINIFEVIVCVAIGWFGPKAVKNAYRYIRIKRDPEKFADDQKLAKDERGAAIAARADTATLRLLENLAWGVFIVFVFWFPDFQLPPLVCVAVIAVVRVGRFAFKKKFEREM